MVEQGGGRLIVSVCVRFQTSITASRADIHRNVGNAKFIVERAALGVVFVVANWQEPGLREPIRFWVSM